MPERDAFGNPVEPATPPAAAAAPVVATTPLAPPEVAAPPAPSPRQPEPYRPGSGTDAGTLGWTALACSVGGVVIVPIVLSIVGLVLASRARQAAGTGQTPGQVRAAAVIGWGGLVLWGAIPVLIVIALAIHATGN